MIQKAGYYWKNLLISSLMRFNPALFRYSIAPKRWYPITIKRIWFDPDYHSSRTSGAGFFVPTDCWRAWPNPLNHPKNFSRLKKFTEGFRQFSPGPRKFTLEFRNGRRLIRFWKWEMRFHLRKIRFWKREMRFSSSVDLFFNLCDSVPLWQ